MNRIYILLLLGILLATACDDRLSTIGNLNEDQSYAFSLFDTTGLCKSPIGILISKEILPPETLVLGPPNTTDIYSPDTPTWLIFVDLKFSAYWAHECQYHFIDTSTGKISSIDARFPPQKIPMDTVMVWGKLYK